MKRLLTFALLIVCTLSSWAYNTEVDGIYYNVVKELRNAEVTSGDTKYTGSVVIPSSITVDGVECTVKSIGRDAFRDCYGLTLVSIPSTITSIGPSAFQNSSTLIAVLITDLEAWCRIKFDDQFSNPLGEAHNLYLNGELITDLEIPESVSSISNFTFYGVYLNSVTIGTSVKSIGFCAFKGSNMASLSIGESVTSIGQNAFDGCYNLTSLTIPDSVTSIGDDAFNQCENLTSLTLGNSLNDIGSYAFYNCNHLLTVTIPNSVTSIGMGAFCSCSRMTSLTIGSSVRSIGERAFSRCKELADVYCYAVDVPTTKSDVFENAEVKFATLYVPEASIELYKSKQPWSNFGSFRSMECPTIEEDPEGPQCATPEVSYADGKLQFTCSTPGVIFRYTLTDTDIKATGAYSDGIVELSATYVIEVYAIANGYRRSDVVTYTICWYDMEADDDAILVPSQQPAIVTMRGNEVIVMGADMLRDAAFYDLDGSCLGIVPVVDGRASIVTTSDAVIVRLGNKSVKLIR